jgi:TetR/AcrR family transcriptional repressor of bet genes
MRSSASASEATGRFAPRDVRRRQLIHSAIDSIAKRGFADTTLRHVTEGVDLSLGVVNYHFDSKEALYDATLRHLAEEHYDVWTSYLDEAGEDPAAQLDAIVRADFDEAICTRKKLAVWFAFWGQAKYRPNYLRIHRSFDGERQDMIRRLCSVLAGDYAGDGVDADSAARMIVAQADGAWLYMMLFPSEATRQQYRDDCQRLLARLFPRHFPVSQS